MLAFFMLVSRVCFILRVTQVYCAAFFKPVVIRNYGYASTSLGQQTRNVGAGPRAFTLRRKCLRNLK